MPAQGVAVLRSRGIDLHFPDILSLTRYTNSPVLSQRDSEVLKAQQIVKQYFEENYSIDNPGTCDAFYFYTASDEIQKAAQQCETWCGWSEPIRFDATDPIVSLSVDDFTGLVDGMYASDARSPTLSKALSVLEKLEESVAWILAQQHFQPQFVNRAVCCQMLFSDKLKPEVYLYVNGSGESSHRNQAEQEAGQFRQHARRMQDLIRALDFQSLLNGLKLVSHVNQLEKVFTTVMNQQFQQLLNKLASTFQGRYLPILDQFCQKCLLDRNVTYSKFLSGVQQAKQVQLKKLASLPEYQNQSELDRKQMEQHVLAQFDSVADQLAKSLQRIRIPEGSSIGQVCLPLFENISVRVPEVVSSFFQTVLNMLQQFHYTQPSFPEPSVVKLRVVNYLLKRAQDALQALQDAVGNDTQQYQRLQRDCFSLNLDVSKFLGGQGSTARATTSTRLRTVDQDTARAMRFQAEAVDFQLPSVTESQLTNLPQSVSSKLRSALEFLSGLISGGKVK